jgi:hypothetical protein
VPDVGMRLAGAREWVLEVGARSSRTSTCASATVAGVVVGPCASGRPVVVVRQSVSASVGGEALVGSAADGVCVSFYGRASWCVSGSGSGC